jgi:hypothetical protein
MENLENLFTHHYNTLNMKNIYKLLTLALTLTIITSCERDQGDYPYLDRDITIGFRGANGSLLVENGASNVVSATIGASTLVSSDATFSVSVDDSSTAVLGVDYNFVAGQDGTLASGNLLSNIDIVADFENSTEDGKTVVLNLTSNDPSLMVTEAFSQYTITLIKFCPINADFTGSYTLSTTATGIFDSAVFLNGAVTIEMGTEPTDRVISVAPYPEFGAFAPIDFAFSLVCGNVVVPTGLVTGVGCGGSTTIGPAATNGTYDSNDDSSFTIVITDDEGGNCGSPYEAAFVLTKN